MNSMPSNSGICRSVITRNRFWLRMAGYFDDEIGRPGQLRQYPRRSLVEDVAHELPERTASCVRVALDLAAAGLPPVTGRLADG